MLNTILRSTVGVSVSGLLLLYCIFLGLGVAAGAGAADQADSLENATVEYNGTHIIYGGNATALEENQLSPLTDRIWKAQEIAGTHWGQFLYRYDVPPLIVNIYVVGLPISGLLISKRLRD